jgi:hypothetical protein
VARYFLLEQVVVAAVTSLLLFAVPGHTIAAIAAVIVTWIILQGVSAFQFMRALYRGDVIEVKGVPRRYAVAQRATVNWYARRFMILYLKAAGPLMPRSSQPEDRHS